MTISEIRDILKQETVEKTVLEEIMADERKGVRQLVDAYIRRLNRESAERFRVEDMYEPESSFYKKGLEYVVGIDEVGRGPLAGPVTVAAVILKPHFLLRDLMIRKKWRLGGGKKLQRKFTKRQWIFPLSAFLRKRLTCGIFMRQRWKPCTARCGI